MAEPVTPRDWRRKRAQHTSTTQYNVPPELMQLLQEQMAALNDLARRVGMLEHAIGTAITSMDEIDRKRSAA